MAAISRPMQSREDFAHDSEFKVYERLLYGLDSEWVIIPNLEMVLQGTYREREADLLLVHQTHGMVLIEVKSSFAIWDGEFYKVRDDSKLDKDPTHQLREQRRALAEKLDHLSPGIYNKIRRVVATPSTVEVTGNLPVGYHRIHLADAHENVPSVPTIWRVLKARGFVAPQPHKRPKSSFHRFEADFPNECWQADMTHVVVADNQVFEVLNVIDDHSRLCVASRAFVRVTSPDVVRTLHTAAATWGYPASLLTDNGAIFTASAVKGTSATEAELLSLGIASKHGKPYHPQTQGKVERFHQTLKKYLAQQAPPETKRQLQGQLDRFVDYYNVTRPHRSLDRQRPIQVFNAREKAVPTGPKIDTTGYRVRRDKVDDHGVVTLRYHSRVHHIGVGRAYAGWRVIMLVAGTDVRILGLDGSPLRHLTLDPTKDYQPQA